MEEVVGEGGLVEDLGDDGGIVTGVREGPPGAGSQKRRRSASNSTT
jgi:hypothetical protein